MSGSTLDLSFHSKAHIVKAGAGAGKTYNLVQCVAEAYQHFVKANGKDPRFVLTTFTRKATQELRERMVLKACEIGDPRFFAFVTDPGHLTISTIHGVLAQFLKEFGHLFEMDLSFRILEGDEEALLLESVARELLVEKEGTLRWLSDFTFSQFLGMLKSYQYNFGKNNSLRAPTADEMWEHTLNYVELKKSQVLSEIDEGLKIIDDPPYIESLTQIKDFIQLWEPGLELEIPTLARKTKRESFPVEFHESFQNTLKRFKTSLGEVLLSRPEMDHLSQRWSEFSEIAKEYALKVEERKKRGGFVTLGGLENQTMKILNESPFLGRIFSENFDFWLIDEFQDTSFQQLQILNHLIGDRPRFVVGDPQQSIYLFRGAEAQIFDQEWNRISSESGRNSLLQKNYRSRKNLLELLNQMMSHSPQFSSMQPNDQSEDEKEVACFIQANDLEDELKGLFERAVQLCGESGRWDEICVLGRTHDDLFKVASYFKSKGLPTHVHSPSGYFTRREIQDALSLYKFLINPHDDLNLLQILRAPWLKVDDDQLKNWMEQKTNSLWNFLSQNLNQLREKFLALKELEKADRQLETDGLLKTFTDLIKRINFIEQSAQFDPSGRVEANIWKLIGKLGDLKEQGGSHALDVFTQLTEESDAVAATEPNCVNLMTIHGSKGLEFEHVFFPRLGRRFQMAKRGGIAYSNDSDLFVFSLKDDDEDPIVSTYEREWIDQKRIKEKEEVERWFYVALTRARQSVTLSWNLKELTKDSWVNLFNLENFNSPYLLRKFGPFEDQPPYASDDGNLSVRDPYHDLNQKEEILSRSSFSEMSMDKSEAWTYESLSRKFLSQAKGIHWHKLFEAIRYQDVDEGLKEYPFLEAMKEPPFKEVLSGGFVEWGFQLKVNSKILEGQIDLWGMDSQNRLWVIDYKTGSSKSSEKAIKQVQFYLWVLKYKGLTPSSFNWAVIYPLEEKVVSGVITGEEFESLESEFGL